MPKITFADPDAAGLTAVIQQLEREGFAVSFCKNGDVIGSILADVPDLCMVAGDAPHMDGLRLVQGLRQKLDVPIIVYAHTMREVEEINALQMGADDYISKHVSPRVWIARINAILRRRQGALGDDTLTRGALTLNKQRHLAAWNGQEIAMTVTEFMLLYTLALRPGFIKTREQLHDAVYGAQSLAESRAIDSHIKRLRKKIRTYDANFNAIETLYGIGYRYVEG